MNGVIFVWFWQIDVLQVDDQTLAFFWSIDATLGVSRLRAHLVQLLDHVEGRSLGITVNNSDLCRFHLFDKTCNHEIFTATFGADKDKAFVIFEQWSD